jgi:hypothetical protein
MRDATSSSGSWNLQVGYRRTRYRTASRWLTSTENHDERLPAFYLCSKRPVGGKAPQSTPRELSFIRLVSTITPSTSAGWRWSTSSENAARSTGQSGQLAELPLVPKERGARTSGSPYVHKGWVALCRSVDQRPAVLAALQHPLRFALYLPDPLPRDVEFLAEFGEGSGLAIV